MIPLTRNVGVTVATLQRRSPQHYSLFYPPHNLVGTNSVDRKQMLSYFSFGLQKSFLSASLGLCLASVTVLAQNPPAYFVTYGNIANGDQYDPGYPYSFDTSTGGGSKSRIVPNTIGNGQPYTSGWGTLSVSTSFSSASMSATFSGSMDPVDASRGCGFYGCGWSPLANTQYSGITVYVRGDPGTQFHLLQSASGSLSASVTKTHACDNNWANAQASASWAGTPQVNATSENGVGGYCGIPVPKSGSAAVSENHVVDGTSTNPTIVYNGQTYSYAYGMGTDLSLSIYAEQDPDFTAHSGGDVTVNIAANLVLPGQRPPTAAIALIGTPAVNSPVALDGSASQAYNGASLTAYNWTITDPGGHVIGTPSGPTTSFTFPAAGTYSVMLMVTDSNGQTGSTTATVNVSACVLPTSETTGFDGWDPVDGSVGTWRQTITAPIGMTFSGNTLRESDAGGTSDTCWFPGSAAAKTSGPTSGIWTVNPDNTWGDDLVGWTATGVAYYRAHGRAPCGFTVHQQMTMMCPNGSFQNYGPVNNLASSFTATTVTSVRAGGTATRRY